MKEGPPAGGEGEGEGRGGVALPKRSGSAVGEVDAKTVWDSGGSSLVRVDWMRRQCCSQDCGLEEGRVEG